MATELMRKLPLGLIPESGRGNQQVEPTREHDDTLTHRQGPLVFRGAPPQRLGKRNRAEGKVCELQQRQTRFR